MRPSYALGCDYLSACEQAIKLNRQLNDFRKYKDNLREKSLMFVWTNYKESRLYKKLSERTAKSYAYAIERLCKIKSGSSGTAFKDIPLVNLIMIPHITFMRSLSDFSSSIKQCIASRSYVCFIILD